MGAIGDAAFLPVLRKFSSHELAEISETCQIAVDLIEWKATQATEASKHGGTSGEYLSHDPAPPFVAGESVDGTSFPHEKPLSVDDLKDVLMDPKRSLFHRYRAMFSLRNMNNDAAAAAIADGFGDNSALFRHEVAYVLGQMQRKVTIPQLTVVLRNTDEHKMVRHEAAEALGAIGGEAIEAILRDYEQDPEAVVKESALVALDTIDYWTNFQQDTAV